MGTEGERGSTHSPQMQQTMDNCSEAKKNLQLMEDKKVVRCLSFTHIMPEFVEKLKDRIPIEDVLAEDGIELKSRGPELVGCHAKKHNSKSKTSLTVNPGEGLYHCFNCGEGGDVITWLELNRGMSFMEAVRYLADKAGMPMPDLDPEEQKRYEQRRKERQSLEAVYTVAAQFFHQQMNGEIIAYCQEKWGLTEETLRSFLIGFAPPDGDGLKEYLKERFDDELLRRSGLFIRVKGKGFLDFFRGRLVFPYWKNNQVVYFIARSTKYTPDVHWEKYDSNGEFIKYKKLLTHSQNHLYVSQEVENRYLAGEDTARGADELIITEGIADCYAAIQGGFACVSPVTVQFRKNDFQKLAQIARRAKTVYIINDNEENKAGEKGAWATAEYLEGQGIDVRLVELPRPDRVDKVDLADYLREHDPNDLRELLAEAKTLLDLNIDILKTNPADEEARDLAVAKIASLEPIRRSSEVNRLHATLKPLKVTKSAVQAAVDAAVNETEKEKEKADLRLVADGEQAPDFREMLMEYLQKSFEVISYEGTGEDTILKLWSKKRKEVEEIRLSTERSVPPLLALEEGSPLVWAHNSGLKLPQHITHKGTKQGYVERPPHEVERLLISEVLRCFQDMVAGASRHSRLDVMKDGLHCRGDLLVWVNGSDVFLQNKGGGWHRVNSPVHGEIFFQGNEGWTDTSPLEDSPYTPEQVLEILLEILLAGWKWSDPRTDPYIIALSMMKAAITDMFERQEMIWITGAKGCGKSRLTKGLASGQAHFPRLVENCNYITNATQAGLTAKFYGRKPLLLFDEFEHTKYRNQILTLLRSSMDSNTGVLRGTPGLEYKEQLLKCPAWLSSIDTLDVDQDIDRVIRIDLPKVKGHGAPETLVSQGGLWGRIDPEKLRQSLTLCLLPYVWELQEAYQEIKSRELPGERLVEFRLKEGLIGLLATAQICGESVDELSQAIFESKRVAVEEHEELAVENRLFAAVLDTPFEILEEESGTYGNKQTRKRTTISGLIEGNGQDIDRLRDIGFYYEHETNLLYLNWPTITSAILANSEFRGKYERDLLHLIKRHNSFLRHARTRKGGLQKSLTCLQLDEDNA